MHTTHELTSEAFEYRDAEGAVDRREVVPHVSIDDRLGVVMDDPTDGFGAGNFVLSCVTAFYDRFRERSEEFYEYPDYFTFQASPNPVDYQEFDVWPDHKNVSVPRDPEAILRAINDRGITVLLVPDSALKAPDIDDVTRNSATRRIDACYLYGPDGDPDDAEFAIDLPCEPAAKWYRETADAAGVGSERFGCLEDDETSITQWFRRIDLWEAVHRLPASGNR
jgi:hypothetical protein